MQIDINDPYPKIICISCLSSLIAWYKFRNLSIKSKQILAESSSLDKQELLRTEPTTQDSKDKIDTTHACSKNSSVQPQVSVELFIDSVEEDSSLTDPIESSNVDNDWEEIENEKMKDRKIICDVCGKVFSADSKIEAHMRTHTGDRPFKCDICGVRKYTAGDVKSHMKIHSDELQYDCKLCGKKFKWQGNLTRHLRWHRGEKSHKCSVCGRLFADKSDIKKHRSTHWGKKLVECKICNCGFRQKNALKKHCLEIHKIKITF